MNYIFDPHYIRGHEILFYSFLITIIIIIITTIFLVLKETGKTK